MEIQDCRERVKRATELMERIEGLESAYGFNSIRYPLADEVFAAGKQALVAAALSELDSILKPVEPSTGN